MNIEWVMTHPDAIKTGDRVAPLASWTLDVLAVSSDGYWIVVNHDTNDVHTFWPGKAYYRLVVTDAG